MASEDGNQHNDVVPNEQLAPPGWSKKFTPKKGGTPQRKDVFFVSPTGEEIKTKRQLDQYLKSHPGGPAASEFDWGTGDTPRRSVRLSEKSKADVMPASLSPKKRQKKTGTKGAQEKNNADAEEEEEATVEKDATSVEAKETVEGSSVDAKDALDEDFIPGKPESEDGEKRPESDDGEKRTDIPVALEKPSATAPVGTETDNLNAGIGDSNNATTVLPDAKLEESKETSSPSKVDESNEASIVVPESKNDETKEMTDAPDGKVDGGMTASGDIINN